MTTGCYEHRKTLLAMTRGELDAVAPEAVARFETHLNACPRCAAALSNQRATDDERAADPVWSVATSSAPRLNDAECAALWARVSSTVNHSTARRKFWRRVRLVSPLAVAAAGLLMMALWQQAAPPVSKPWKFEAASWVEVDGVEVFDDHSGIFVSSGGGGTLPFIWVIDETGDDS